jgi:DNA (cytosine-5)-methyltransferase 1
MKRPIAIDLFSGAGGLSLGFEQAGFDVMAAVEIDPIHAAIHELNFPNCTVICGDIRKLDAEEIRVRSGIGNRPLDVLFGGPPCQGFSLIGHRVLEDPRNHLVFHFLRLVLALKPKIFVMENVPGMATGKSTQLLSELIEQFQSNGYRVRLPYEILNAFNHGVPQDRRRVFILGARLGVKLPQYPRPTTGHTRTMKSKNGTGTLFATSFGLKHCPTVADAIGDLPDLDSYDELLTSDTLRIKLNGGSTFARILRGDKIDPNDFSYSRKRDRKLLTGCLRAVHTDLSKRRFTKTVPGTTEPISRFYKLSMDGVCNTLRAGTASDRGAFSAPRPIHPTLPRCITVREAARLHSYPDWFRFHRTIWHGFRQIGNSVPPLLGRAVAAEAMQALGIKPVRPDAAVPLGHDEMSAFNMKEAANRFGVPANIIPPRKRLIEMRNE